MEMTLSQSLKRWLSADECTGRARNTGVRYPVRGYEYVPLSHSPKHPMFMPEATETLGKSGTAPHRASRTRVAPDAETVHRKFPGQSAFQQTKPGDGLRNLQ